MADVIDQGSDQEEQNLRMALEVQAARASVQRLPYTGTCHYCQSELLESTEDQPRFCDQDCRNDFEEEKRILEAQGRTIRR